MPLSRQPENNHVDQMIAPRAAAHLARWQTEPGYAEAAIEHARAAQAAREAAQHDAAQQITAHEVSLELSADVENVA